MCAQYVHKIRYLRLTLQRTVDARRLAWRFTHNRDYTAVANSAEGIVCNPLLCSIGGRVLAGVVGPLHIWILGLRGVFRTVVSNQAVLTQYLLVL